jgi:hypothetical protein
MQERSTVTESFLTELSRAYEIVWANARNLTPEQFAEFTNYVKENSIRLRTLFKGNSDAAAACGRATMGIYHHPEIQEPPELKYKLNQN